MPLINGKVELKLKWTNHFVLSANGNDNDSGNSNIIFFTIKDTKLYDPVVILSAKDNQKLSKLLSKGECIRMNIKQKVRIPQMIIDVL